MATLAEVYKKYSAPDRAGDKGTLHNYIEIYEEHIVNKFDCSLLEIGICAGHSLAMWLEHLPGAKIYGIDVDVSRITFDLGGCVIIQADAASQQALHLVGSNKFDYIIDDGSHQLQHQIASFELLYDSLKPDGKYFIEDIADVNFEPLKQYFNQRNLKYDIHDMRYKSNRYDDILFIIYR